VPEALRPRRIAITSADTARQQDVIDAEKVS
jgi:hypothetical protein